MKHRCYSITTAASDIWAPERGGTRQNWGARKRGCRRRQATSWAASRCIGPPQRSAADDHDWQRWKRVVKTALCWSSAVKSIPFESRNDTLHRRSRDVTHGTSNFHMGQHLRLGWTDHFTQNPRQSQKPHPHTITALSFETPGEAMRENLTASKDTHPCTACPSRSVGRHVVLEEATLLARWGRLQFWTQRLKYHRPKSPS